MTIWYVQPSRGCLLVEAASKAGAKIHAAQLLGCTSGPFRASIATEKEKAWVRMMGGRVHQSRFNEKIGDPTILNLQED